MSEIKLSIPDEALLALKLNSERIGGESGWLRRSSYTNLGVYPPGRRRDLRVFRESCFWRSLPIMVWTPSA